MPFVKHIEGRFKEGKREGGIKKVVGFYNDLSGKAKGLKRFIMSASLEDPQKAVHVSVWETKEDMDRYYSHDQEYHVFFESLKPIIEQEIENKEYEIVGFKI